MISKSCSINYRFLKINAKPRYSNFKKTNSTLHQDFLHFTDSMNAAVHPTQEKPTKALWKTDLSPESVENSNSENQSSPTTEQSNSPDFCTPLSFAPIKKGKPMMANTAQVQATG